MNHLQIIQKVNNSNISEKKGNNILDNNLFFQKLIYIMNDDVFKSFYTDFCKDSSDINIIVIYMKLYIEIENIYQEKFNEKIKPAIMVKILHEIFTDRDMRKKAIQHQSLLS